MTSTVPLAFITILSILCRMQAKKANLFFFGQSERKTVFPPFNFAFPITCLILLFLWLWHYEKAKFKHSRWYVSALWFQSLYEKKRKNSFSLKKRTRHSHPILRSPSHRTRPSIGRRLLGRHACLLACLPASSWSQAWWWPSWPRPLGLGWLKYPFWAIGWPAPLCRRWWNKSSWAR